MERRRGRAWTRLGYGVHRPTSDDSIFAELRAWQEVLPRNAIVTGLTGARVRGLWLPPVPDALPVFVDVPPHRTHSSRRGVRVSRPRQMPDFELIEGVRVATAPECLLACARDLSALDLAVLIDAAHHVGALTEAGLAELTTGSRRGMPQLRRAARLSDSRSESAWETLLRIIHRCADVAVEPQFDIFDSDGHVARADLRIVGAQMIHEYDGLHHRTPEGLHRDLTRDRRLLDAGWHRRGYTARDVARRPGEIMEAAARSVGRVSTQAHLSAWRTLWEASLFSDAGTRKLSRRWNLA